jgi:membrane protease YdiL (CAAX protease family)
LSRRRSAILSPTWSAALFSKWGRTLAIIVLVVLWERKPLASIGLREGSWWDILVVIGGYVVVYSIGHFLDFVLPKRVPSDVQLATMLFPFPLRAAMVLTAAVTEEIESRGFLIERLEALFGSRSLAAALAFAIFLLQHAQSWGIAYAARTALWTAALVAVYLWRRNLLACISLHFLIDATALLRASKIV